MQKALGPTDRKAFRDNYLAAVMIGLAFFLSFGASAQYDSTKQRTPVNGYGFSWKNGKFGSIILPTDTPKLSVADSGGVAFIGGNVYSWTGYLWKLSSGSGSSGGSGFSLRNITSSNFSTSINCPLPALNGDSLQIFWNDLGRFLTEGIEWNPLSGGGFIISVPGFDATANSYNFTIYSNTGPITPGPVLVTSSGFSTSVNCPLPAYNGMQLQVYWNDANRYLVEGTDWSPLAGGGFTITVPGFNATTTNYSFYIFNQ